MNRRSGWVSWKNPVPICLLGMWLAMASTGTRDRLASYRPLMRWRFPGPHDPAHTARLPVTSASAAAANAAASSWRTWIHSIPLPAFSPALDRCTASTTGLRLSPTMP
ncbi:Uncharacterised protein [Mycobacteroides abscessus]|nr:Uncharacterised protein [Mycobacteroides abscessus]